MKAYMHSGEVWSPALWDAARARLRGDVELTESAARYGTESAKGRESEVKALVRGGMDPRDAALAALTDEVQRGILSTLGEARAFLVHFDVEWERELPSRDWDAMEPTVNATGFGSIPEPAYHCAGHPSRPVSPTDPDAIRCAECVVTEGPEAEFTPDEVAAARAEAEGAGWLAPVAQDGLTPEQAAEYAARHPQVAEAAAILRANGMDPTNLSAEQADGILANQQAPQMPAWELLPDAGTRSRDYVIRLPYPVEVGSWGEKADAIHRWYNRDERSWVVAFALMTDFHDGRGPVPAQVGASQYVYSKDDAQHEAEYFWTQAMAAPRSPEPAPGLDPEVAEQVEAGWTVGEAEDIVAHDEGEHDEESVPGCPRCEDTYDEVEPPTPEELRAHARGEYPHVQYDACERAMERGVVTDPEPHVLVNDPNKGVCVCGAITIFSRETGWQHLEA